MKNSRKLLLFDIDGTLVDTGGAGLVSLREGFYEAFPTHRLHDFPSLDLGGATDHGVVMGIFAHFGLPDTSEHRDRFFRSYTERLEGSLRIFAEAGKGRLLPGVDHLLSALAGRDDHRLAILTGNSREGAGIKLRQFAIEHHFSTGAYGDDHHDRNELGPVARRRALETFGEDFLPEDIVVIGDTPRDIACARAFGAKAVAVATGAASREQLAAAAPDLFLENLSDSIAVIEGIERVFSRARDAVWP